MNSQAEIVKSFIQTVKNILPPSSFVDFILFILGEKKCLRTSVPEDQNLNPLAKFCNCHNFPFKADSENYIYIASSEGILDQVFTIDHLQVPQEQELGKLFGYPNCCSKKIAEIGEQNIDSFEYSLQNTSFPNNFKLINPFGYRAGIAFISHVPCKSTCEPSLNQAILFKNFVLGNKHEKIFQPWLEELEKIKKENHEHNSNKPCLSRQNRHLPD